MKLSNPFLLRFALVVSLLGFALAWAVSAQEPSDTARPQAPRWLTVHEYGIQVHVEPPSLGQKNWLLSVRDLGPSLPHLRLDLPPTTAQLEVAGKGSLNLQVQANGDLQVAVPRSWVLARSAPSVQLHVQSQSATLLECSIQSLFL
jgi:hypothetical protein